jgi:hypothetical protein
VVIDTRRAGTLQDKDVFVSHRAVNLDRGLEREKLGDMARRELDAESALFSFWCNYTLSIKCSYPLNKERRAKDTPRSDRFSEPRVRVAREELDAVARVVHVRSKESRGVGEV